MPTRMLRDWTDSEKINSLSPQAEVFFVRLMMKADDFGCFHATPQLLKSALFPFKADLIHSNELIEWLNECANSGLIIVYEVENKKYLKINNFGQRLRSPKPKFPDCGQLADKCPQHAGKCPPEVEEEEKKKTEEEVDIEEEGQNIPSVVVLYPSFDEFWNLYDKKIDKSKCEKVWTKIPDSEKWKIISHVPPYVESTPDIQYRKNPLTYLNSKSWNNDIIYPTNNNSASKGFVPANGFARDLAEIIAGESNDLRGDNQSSKIA